MSDCNSVSTLSGIKLWTDYMEYNLFPPTELDHLYIYQNHYDALMQHQYNVHKLLLSSTSCFSSDTMDTLDRLADLLERAIDLGEKWVIIYLLSYALILYCVSALFTWMQSPDLQQY